MHTQTRIWLDDIRPIRRARCTDPATSHAAAHRAGLFAHGHGRRIVDALVEHGPRAACELQALTGLSTVQIDRRTSELVACGLIRLHLVDGKEVVIGGCRVWEAM